MSNPMQDLHDLGLNPFAVTLLAESMLKSAYVKHRGAEPLTFEFPVRRGDCEGWVGVRITIEAVPAAAGVTARQPVAWRVRGYSQFKTGTPGPWRYFDGAERPKVNNPEDCDMEPLFADGVAPTDGGPNLAEGFDGSAVRPGPNHSTIEIWYDTEAQARAAHEVFRDLIDGVALSREPLPDLILRLHREGYAADQIAAELLALDRVEEADAAGINIAAVIATDGVKGIDGPRHGPEADGSQKPNDAAAIPCAKAGSNDGVEPSAGWVEAGLVCQACAGDAPGGKCKNPKCIGGPIVREMVPAAGVSVDTSAMLHAAHDQLHRLVATFVPGNDGAYTETTALMRRIREALPGVAFDGGTSGVLEVPRG